MLRANQTCCNERAWSMAAKSARYCRPVATRAANVAATRSAGRLPEPSSSMAKCSRSCSDAGSDRRSKKPTIALRGRLQKSAVSPAAISSATATPPPSRARGRITPASGAVISAMSSRLARSSSRLSTAAPAPTATGALRRVLASITKAASPLGPGRIRLAPQLLSVTTRMVRIRLGCPLPSSSR